MKGQKPREEAVFKRIEGRVIFFREEFEDGTSTMPLRRFAV